MRPRERKDHTMTFAPVTSRSIVRRPIAAAAIKTSAPAQNLRRGSKGSAVKHLQAALNKLGYKSGPTDGDFGLVTEHAVRSFQRAHRLKPVGIYGPKTRAALAAALRKTGAKPPPSKKPGIAAPASDYRRIKFRGVTVNRREAQLVLRAERYAKKLGVPTPFRLVQGSYHRGVGGSAHTHDAGGSIDFRTRGLRKQTIAKMVKSLRMAGFAAWSRGNGHDRFSPHIHGVAIGDREAHPSAKAQVQEYFRGGDGLVGSRRDPDRAIGRPVPKWALKYRR
jgi:hypothetical protein